jgi:hypothetical protein
MTRRFGETWWDGQTVGYYIHIYIFIYMPQHASVLVALICEIYPCLLVISKYMHHVL